MDTNRIIADIETEISKLQQVRALLSNAAIRKGRPGGPKSPELSLKVTKPKKRTMSAKGRASYFCCDEGSLGEGKGNQNRHKETRDQI